MLRVISQLPRRFAALLAATLILASIQAAQAAGTDAAHAGETNGGLAYAPQTNTVYRSNGQGLYRSDHGKEWSNLELALPAEARITTVAVSASGDGALYVAGLGLGVLKSADAGKSWTELTEGLPSRNVTAFATHSTLPDTLYALVAEEGIYRSEDGGKSWRLVDKGPQAKPRSIIHVDMEGSMQTGWIFAATEKGVYRAMDCFCGFRMAGSLPGPVTAITYDPNKPKELYATTGQQVFHTANGGEEWQQTVSPGGEVTALAHSPTGVLYALLAEGKVVESRDKGRQWQ